MLDCYALPLYSLRVGVSQLVRRNVKVEHWFWRDQTRGRQLVVGGPEVASRFYGLIVLKVECVQQQQQQQQHLRSQRSKCTSCGLRSWFGQMNGRMSITITQDTQTHKQSSAVPVSRVGLQGAKRTSTSYDGSEDTAAARRFTSESF